MRKLLLTAVGMVLTCMAAGQDTASAPRIPEEQAALVFQTAAKINARDGGQLWGLQVCGPMFVVDAESHYVVANRGDAQGKLRRSGDVWVGELPKEISPANSAVEWSGVKWTMLMWPMTKDSRDRERLVAHECFHRIQADLKLVTRDGVAGHLDGEIGRTWLQLEWRALERALATNGAERKAAVADALLFRNYRRALIKSAAASEDALEMNEGVCEYTGFRLANANEADRRAAGIYALHAGPQKPSFGRSFAYVSGPAYGILMDATGVPWRKKLTPETDWGALLGAAYRVGGGKVSEVSATAAARKYEGETLMAAERERARNLEAKLAEMRKKFIDGPVLVLPIDDKFGYGFDPNNTTSLDENSTVYGWARITGEWGVLETGNGAMMVRESGKIVRVVVPASKEVAKSTSDAWKLELKPGWKVVVAGRAGDQTLKQE
jgi:hypothetical protein